MPTLEGLPDSTDVIRTYYPFYISELEQVNAINLRSVIQQYTQRGVVDVCSDWTQKGYYVVGLERGEVIQGTPPELYKAMAQRTDVIMYTLTLGLYVRRFATKLTGDELYYWSKQSSERILFEMSQLENRRMYETEILYTPIDMNQLSPKILNEPIFKGEMARFFEIETKQLSSLKYTKTLDVPKTEPKRTEYKIIRRPKCSTQPS